MKKLLLASLALALYAALVPHTALAFDSFGFYCAPYTKSFEEGKHYIASSTSPVSITCSYDIPASAAQQYSSIKVGVFKGVPGNSLQVGGGDISPFYPLETPFQNFTDFRINDGTQLIEPKQDDDFFAVVYDGGWWDSNGNPIFYGFQNFFTKGGTPPNNNYQIIKWKWGAKPASEWDPVVIIPGILGSWQDPTTGKWILDPLTHIYDNLINTLKANGYIEGQTLFTLPYDWEQSNIITAQLLKQKIGEIKATCGCSKVDVVAHSMGGLVATQYIMSDSYGDDVDQLFMLGTPIIGAPKAYKVWEGGDTSLTENTGQNLVLSRIFTREAIDSGYSNIFEYIHNKPVASIQELLPVYQNYLRFGTTFLQYPAGYPKNPFLENLVGSGLYYEKVLNKVQTYVVVGNLIPSTRTTPIGFSVKDSTQLPLWQDGEIVSTISGDGDGTVPRDNAIYLSGPEKEFVGVSHNQLASSSSAYVFSQLTGSAPATIIGKKIWRTRC